MRDRENEKKRVRWREGELEKEEEYQRIRGKVYGRDRKIIK